MVIFLTFAIILLLFDCNAGAVTFFLSHIFLRTKCILTHLTWNVTCTLLYSIKHPNPTFSKTAALINIHSSFYLVTILSFMSLILCPFLVFFEEKKRVVRHINFLYLYFLLCHTDSVPPNIQQLMRCMRKMPSHILILKCKAIEMSSERFRSVKCNENIFVWKYHNQHSCALRTVWGKKNWRPCQMHSAPASVIFLL